MLQEPTPDFLDRLKDRLGPKGWTAPEEAARWLEEPRGVWKGETALVARPSTVEETAAVLAACHEARVAVVPFGGGTGLVGGQVRAGGPRAVVVSMDRMAAIRRLDPAAEAITVEAGAILADVHAAAESADRRFPLDLASSGSARIGGLLAANAGGLNVLRYGNARDLVLGIEAALPDGSILRDLKTLRKDNTGFDVGRLLVGSEGALGIITAASLKLFPRPREAGTAFLTVSDPQAAAALLRRLRGSLGETVSSFELMSGSSFAWLPLLGAAAPKPPLEGAWCVLTEAEGGAGSGVGERLEEALAEAFEAGEATDAVLATSEAQRAAFWAVRESIPEANRRVGAIASHDVSLPLERIAEFLDECAAAVAQVDPSIRINAFGHLGDGNLHYNLFPAEGASRADYADRKEAATRAVHDLVHALDGSISAEHGIGRLRAADLLRYGDPGKIAAMRAIKTALDPHGIMNPGAVLAETAG